MTEILDGGVELIRWLENFHHPFLNRFFMAVTDMGSTMGYMLFLPILWWGVSWKLSVRIFVVLMLSVYLNSLLKELFALPRPFLYAELASLRTRDGFSFPSGHAQQAALFWSLLAVHFRNRWFTTVAAVLIIAIGFSRVYLGVHFPSDVVVGWALGLGIAWAFTAWSELALDRVAELELNAQIGLALAVPAVLALAHPSTNAAIAMGGLAGGLCGLAFAIHKGLYPEGVQRRNRRQWLLVGLAGLPALYLFLRMLSPGEASAYYHLYLWARFATIGLWVSFLVPRIVSFTKRRPA